ncbi:hypothetical protein QR680_012524 [Steinernema hermaphroditum]|uniref:Uncharacterized protein n=1 Tax=Steinernema hermaphroditum TaxID=289476 RepID=A0AA39I2A2_9BILA|nr:hypothetical protein QR680_012524 [Steinernema hermaphroditum]
MQASKRFMKMKQLSRGDALQQILFMDEKIFTVEPYRNTQNRRELPGDDFGRRCASLGRGERRKHRLEAATGLGPGPRSEEDAGVVRGQPPGLLDEERLASNSPDLNPLDYAIWGIMEKKACAIKHKSIDSLKRALEKAWEEITPEMIAAILKNFRKRLDACIAAEGSHFECD